jgi:putative hydrolase of HD superfamily
MQWGMVDIKATIGERLQAQFTFLMELDKLKSVLRRSILSHEARRENSSEHSWHVAMMALTLIEYADQPVDPLRVLKMLLVHDVVEIDAGDVYIYDKQSNEGKVEREREAAKRIFGLLPEDQRAAFHDLWEEFEAKETAEAKFAGSCDRLIPLLHNFYAKGHSWKEHGVELASVWEINSVIQEGSKALWDAAREIIDASVKAGYLTDN